MKSPKRGFLVPASLTIASFSGERAKFKAPITALITILRDEFDVFLANPQCPLRVDSGHNGPYTPSSNIMSALVWKRSFGQF
jgi:hypothetical protein